MELFMQKVNVYSVDGIAVGEKIGDINEASVILPRGMYVVKAQTVNGDVVTRKIVNE